MACGAEFYTWSLRELFRGRQDRLICAECGAASNGANIWERSAECDDAMAYYVAGHTVAETAKKFGVSKARINGSVKTRGLTNGRQWGEISDEQRERQRYEAEQRLIERLDVLGFDYLGGYTNSTGIVTLKCKTCGDEFERTVSFLKHGNVICQKCEHEKTLIRQAERREAQRQESAKKQARREAEREAKRLANNLEPSAYQLSRMALLDDVHVCKVCGKEYTLREYMQSTGSKYYRDSGYCSAECRDAYNKERVKISHKGRQDSHRHRAVKFGCAYDSSVTLAKLIKRDGLRCAICGEMCDPNDHSWSKYSGPMYPSIDHIVPMSKGGGHVWDNVQIAHIICNSEKGTAQ
jgi:5-methylcytosine-specific restriction endonuclease McrA/uncharacterized Zn finger protein (UPF0148 family)